MDVCTVIGKGKGMGKTAVLYHVTDFLHAKQIQKEGRLCPMQGENVICTGDVPAVYFCDYRDVPFWQQILGKPIVLEVAVSEDIHTFQKRNYTLYEEYLVTHPVSPIWIRDITGKITEFEKQNANRELCHTCLWDLNRICLAWARYYNGIVDISADLLALETKTQLDILQRLNYEELTEMELQDEMKEMTDSCCYAFTDTYNNTSVRLWEQLVRYPEDKWADIRTKFHSFIKTTFPSILYTNTGGYVGVEEGDKYGFR